jgi:AcrR family transcriptional regulator
MSTANPDTRTRLLAAARRLFVERGLHGAGIEDIARAAGVTRQAVYAHHFASKGELVLALLDYVESVEGLSDTFEGVREASSGLEMLDRAVRAIAATTPKIIDVARVLDAARATDPDAEAAWQNRMALRRTGIGGVVRRLESDGVLAPGWTLETATDFAWTLLSVQVHELLRNECGWSAEQFVHRVTGSLKAALVREPRRKRG